MKKFDEISLRLKQQLRVTLDKDVAAFFGITGPSWARRKQSGTFPEDKLYTLAAKRPELNLDVQWVLTGGHLAAPKQPVLLPCPFCGKQPESKQYDDSEGFAHVVCCTNRSCPSGPITGGDTPQEAAAQWNTRA